MPRSVWLATACAVALAAAPAFAEDKPNAVPGPKADGVEVILATLDNEVQLKEGANINEIPLFELVTFLSKQYDLSFVVNEELFKLAGVENIMEAKATFAATQLRGLTIRRFLELVLDSVGATTLVKKGAVEIVPLGYAAKVTKSATADNGNGRVRPAEPLVSVVVKEKPLAEVVAKLAADYDLNVLVAPQAGDARTGPVTARLLNVPADTAVELLALQCDLRVVRRDNVFLITSKEQADEMVAAKRGTARPVTAPAAKP